MAREEHTIDATSVDSSFVCVGDAGLFRVWIAGRHGRVRRAGANVDEARRNQRRDAVRLLALFGQAPSLYIWLGGSLIFASTAYITLRERQKRLG